MTSTRPNRPHPGDVAPDQGRSVRSAAHGGATLLIATIGAAVLSIVALVLWYPIDMAAIERADDAGWDESLLYPHQFLMTAVLLGMCLCSWVAAIVTARSYLSRASS